MKTCHPNQVHYVERDTAADVAAVAVMKCQQTLHALAVALEHVLIYPELMRRSDVGR